MVGVSKESLFLQSPYYVESYTRQDIFGRERSAPVAAKECKVEVLHVGRTFQVDDEVSALSVKRKVEAIRPRPLRVPRESYAFCLAVVHIPF